MENLIRKSTAGEYLDLNDQWDRTDKDVIVSNIERLLGERYSLKGNQTELQRIIMFLTDSGRHTVYAWLNRSRDNVKIPLIKLCTIADELDIEVAEFFR